MHAPLSDVKCQHRDVFAFTYELNHEMQVRQCSHFSARFPMPTISHTSLQVSNLVYHLNHYANPSMLLLFLVLQKQTKAKTISSDIATIMSRSMPTDNKRSYLGSATLPSVGKSSWLLTFGAVFFPLGCLLGPELVTTGWSPYARRICGGTYLPVDFGAASCTWHSTN